MPLLKSQRHNRATTLSKQAKAADPPHEFLDPITLDLMTDPVKVKQTNQVYDRSSIEQWQKVTKSSTTKDPLTGLQIEKMVLLPQPELCAKINAYRKTVDLSTHSLRSRHHACTTTIEYAKKVGRGCLAVGATTGMVVGCVVLAPIVLPIAFVCVNLDDMNAGHPPAASRRPG